MNTLDIIQTLYADLKNSNDSLNQQDPIVLSDLSSRIQGYARRLKKLESEEIKGLKKNGPKISGYPDNPVITLLRDDKPIHYRLDTIYVAKTDDKITRRELKIMGEPDEEGSWHFIYDSGSKNDQPPFGICINKEEALILKKALKALDDDANCLFCGEKKSICGEAHAVEMREAMREISYEEDRRRGY